MNKFTREAGRLRYSRLPSGRLGGMLVARSASGGSITAKRASRSPAPRPGRPSRKGVLWHVRQR